MGFEGNLAGSSAAEEKVGNHNTQDHGARESTPQNNVVFVFLLFHFSPPVCFFENAKDLMFHKVKPQFTKVRLVYKMPH